MHPIPKNKIFVVVPVYDEDVAVIRETISGILPFYKQVVLVDDGSTSDIKEKISDLSVYFLRHSANLGQGASLQTGTDFALLNGAEYIVHFDADGQHDPADIARMLRAVQEDIADIMLGSRFMSKAGADNVPLVRRIILQFGRIINFLITGMWLTDAHQGLRVLNKKAASLVRLRENRQAHATEILLEIKKHRLRCQEMGVSTLYTKYSLAKGQKSLNAFNIFIDLVLNKFFR